MGFFDEVGASLGVVPAVFFEGLDIDPDNPPKSLAWDDFCTACERLEAICGGTEMLEDLGPLIAGSPSFRPLVGFLKMFASPTALYIASHTWGGPRIFPHLSNGLERHPDGTLSLSITIPSKSRDCPQFFLMTLGLLRALPIMMGLGEGFVELTLSPRRGVYRVVPPGSTTIWARFKNAIKVFFGMQSVFDAMAEQQRKLQKQYRDLQKIQHELEFSALESEIARGAAEEALQIKTDFLAVMSHELRTPMNGVIGASDLLMGTSLRAPQREYVNIINTSGKVLLGLINDVLDFSKIESGKMTFESVPFELQAIFEDTVGVLQGQIQNKSLSLQCVLHDNLPRVAVGDPIRLKQILLNLVSNAVKYTPSGGITISAVMVGEQLRCSVQDTGIGIDEVAREAIFESFTQADASTTRRYGGTGLGLSISRRLVEIMEGEIGVESTVGEGSTFWFSVPLRTHDAQQLYPPVFPVRSASISQRRSLGAAPRILLAEDQSINQKIIKTMIQQLGLDCDVACDGLEAVDMASDGGYALILMDWRMPRMDGVEATRLIRECEGQDRRVPILAITANVLDGDRQKCLTAGMDGYVPKPITRDALYRALANWIDLSAPVPKKGPPTFSPEEDEGPSTVSGPFDMGALSSLQEGFGEQGNANFIPDLLDDYLVSARSAIEPIGKAIEHRDCHAVAVNAHRLKGTSRQVGAMDMGDLAERLERATQLGDCADSRASFEAILRELSRMESYVSVLRKSFSPISREKAYWGAFDTLPWL